VRPKKRGNKSLNKKPKLARQTDTVTSSSISSPAPLSKMDNLMVKMTEKLDKPTSEEQRTLQEQERTKQEELKLKQLEQKNNLLKTMLANQVSPELMSIFLQPEEK
jgi:hypothetical protein